MIKKYNEESEKYKALYIPNVILLKSYLTGIVFSVVISALFFLPLFNVLFLKHYLTFISILVLASTLLFVYFIFLFKDRALVEYMDEAKKVNLHYIRLIDMMFISIICIVIFAVFLIFFRWW